MLPILVEGDDLHGDVPGAGILLQLAQHRPPEHVWQKDIERDRERRKFPGKGESVGAARGDQDLKSDVPREIDEDARVVGIVLHDQQRPPRLARDALDRRTAAAASPRSAAAGPRRIAPRVVRRSLLWPSPERARRRSWGR